MSMVEWADSARDQLADIWVAATPEERDHIAAIVERLIRRLENDPLDVGECRAGGMRIEICPPLAVSFWFRRTNPESGSLASADLAPAVRDGDQCRGCSPVACRVPLR